MEKEELISKLSSLGIETTNCFKKSTFLLDKTVYVALYGSETKDDFYFFNLYDKKIYVFNKVDDTAIYKQDEVTKKYLIPITDCSVIWEDKPFKEVEDLPFKEMTLRQYACIKLKVPDTGIAWLDTIIKKSHKYVP
jgi:hypothetical protein